MNHPLDNIIWQALTTRQTSFAQAAGNARRFIAEVGPLAGFSEPGDAAYESLAELAGGGVIALFLPAPYQPLSGWKVTGGAPLLQMVWDKNNNGELISSSSPIALGDADSAHMLELATLAKPGPFGSRTHELGSFFGIRQQGKLVAMAGERMKVEGYTEVSAVCTHPDHTGHGYAAVLMSEVIQGIVKRGETPFLHVREDNQRAIELYIRLGFRKRVLNHYVILSR